MMVVTHLVAFFAGAIFTATTIASPVPVSDDPPWTKPCQPFPVRDDKLISGHDVPHSSTSLREQASDLAIQSAEAFTMAEALKKQLFVYRLSASLNRARSLEATHVHPLPMAAVVLPWEHFDQTTGVLTNNYRHLSYILAFLELIEDDCSGVNKRDDDVLLEVRNLKHKLFNMLCRIATMLETLSVKLESHVTREVIPSYLLGITNISHIDDRDYVIVRDVVDLLREIKNTHLDIATSS